MHGLINVLSAAPSAALDANVAIEAGPYDYYRARLGYGNTWGDHGLSVRVNGTTDAATSTTPVTTSRRRPAPRLRR